MSKNNDIKAAHKMAGRALNNTETVNDDDAADKVRVARLVIFPDLAKEFLSELTELLIGWE